MKKTIYLMLALLGTNLVMAQKTNLTIFHEEGEAFTLYLNGMKKNDSPKANVKVEGLKADAYKAKIAFNNKSMKSFTKPLWFEEPGYAYTFRIHQKNNGKMTLRLVSQTAIEQTEDEPQISEQKYEDPQQTNHSTEGTNMQETTTITHSTTTHAGHGHETSDDTESVGVNMKVNESGMDVSMNDNGEQMNMTVDFELDDAHTETTTSTTTTTTTTVTHEGGGVEEAIVEQETAQQTATPQYESGGCHTPMSSMDFEEAKQSIESKDFEDSKLKIAKRIAKSDCLTSSQVKTIMALFDFEDSRLEFSKFAYEYVYDPHKYYIVNDAFEFEMSIDELDEYLESVE
ncbi:MAG: DUF4476 domain-containing protein [Candidatus Delongbacteria bacterium]|jgi:hypothetical protein|nr:DUF4476 domain-containing protein [Candidatus Delongbacteria bacterium]